MKSLLFLLWVFPSLAFSQFTNMYTNIVESPDKWVSISLNVNKSNIVAVYNSNMFDAAHVGIVDSVRQVAESGIDYNLLFMTFPTLDSLSLVFAYFQVDDHTIGVLYDERFNNVVGYSHPVLRLATIANLEQTEASKPESNELDDILGLLKIFL